MEKEMKLYIRNETSLVLTLSINRIEKINMFILSRTIELSQNIRIFISGSISSLHFSCTK